MVRETAVREWMTTDLVTFAPDENVRDAMRRLVTEDVDAGPVVDDVKHDPVTVFLGPQHRA